MRVLWIAGLSAALSAASPALAQNYQAKDANNATQTFGAQSVSGVLYPIHAMVQQPTALSAFGLVPAKTAVAAGSLVLKAAPGNLYAVSVTAGASAGFLMLFDATSAPADGTVTPVECKPVAANAGLAVNYAPGPPAAFATGITAVFSTTGCFTKTISATAFIAGMSQ